MRALTLAGSLLVAAAVAVGCSEKTKQEARDAGRQTAQAARAAGDAVQSAAQDAVDNVERASDDASTLKQAGQSARDVVNGAADAASAAAQTAKVKAAFVADSSVTAAGIDVDTDAATKTIVLKGHVPSAAQKTAAGRIAAEKASTGYTVRNDLVVR